MPQKAIAVWQAMKPWFDKFFRLQAVHSTYQFIRAIATNPLVQAAFAAAAVVIWTVVRSEFGPYALVAAVVMFGAIYWVRNQVRFGSEINTLQRLLTKPPEVRMAKEYIEKPLPEDYKWLRAVKERNKTMAEGGVWPIGKPNLEAHYMLDGLNPRVTFTASLWNMSIFTYKIADHEGFVKLSNEDGILTQVENCYLTDGGLISPQHAFRISAEFAIPYESFKLRLQELVEAHKPIAWEFSHFRIFLKADEEHVSFPIRLYAGSMEIPT